jgi:repressor LexA
LPLIGQLAAGSPMMAIENMLGRYPGSSLFTPRADYLPQVRGLSMRDEGILDGDWVVVHKTTQAKSGSSSSRVGDDVTVKRFASAATRRSSFPRTRISRRCISTSRARRSPSKAWPWA